MRFSRKTKIVTAVIAVICASAVLFVPSGALFGGADTPARQLEEHSVVTSSVVDAKQTVEGGDQVSSDEFISAEQDPDKVNGELGKDSDPGRIDFSEIPDLKEKAPYVAPEQSEYADSHYRVTGFKEFDLDGLFPENFIGDTSWDPMGIDDNGIIYFGYTGRRSDLVAGEEVEDFAVFSYNPETDVVKLLGTFIEACRAANNYQYGEAIPKGHTKFYCIDGKMYMASQSFHDFKDGIEGLENYRGSHLFMYDIEKETLVDLSATMPGGVWTEHQGVVSMNYMPEIGKLVGFTHPYADLVFYDLATGTIDRYVQGIPWTRGNPLSRELIVSGDKVYLYRGTEETGYGINGGANFYCPVYCYDYGEDRLYQTGDKINGGFWNGQATTSDGKTTYISGCCSYLFKLDHETGKITFLRDMDADGEDSLGFTYSISMSPDETKLFYIPTAHNPGYIYEYDIATNGVTKIANVANCVYCGSNIVSNNWYYFTRFGDNGSWERFPTLVAFRLERWDGDYTIK